MSDDTLTAVVAKHPKTIGVLFMLFLLVTQIGTVVATSGGYVGP